MTATIKGINLTNEEIQSHVFGDIVKRQVIGELRFSSEVRWSWLASSVVPTLSTELHF